MTILYYTILYYTILYYTILYYTILYYTILGCLGCSRKSLHKPSVESEWTRSKEALQWLSVHEPLQPLGKCRLVTSDEPAVLDGGPIVTVDDKTPA